MSRNGQIEPPEEIKNQPESAETVPEQESTESDSASSETSHKVTGVVQSADGTIKIKCPTCGFDMFAHIGDPQVVCGRCKTVYKATPAPTTHIETSRNTD